jgi:hypothetical protein
MMNRNSGKHVVLSALLLLIGGCATTGTQRSESMSGLLTKARIVDSFSALTANALPMSETTLTTLGSEKPEAGEQVALRGANGATSFVKLYKLPEWQGAYSINVASFMFGGTGDPAIFYPRYVLLKRDFSQTRTSIAKDFIYRTSGTSGMISSTVFINEENRDETFLAITSESPTAVTEELSLAQSVSAVPLVVPFKGGSIAWLIPMGGNEPPKRMRAAVGGEVRVKTELYQPKRIVSTPARTNER